MRTLPVLNPVVEIHIVGTNLQSDVNVIEEFVSIVIT